MEGIAAHVPVALAEAKAFLRIATSEEDATLAALIRAATGLCERFTGLALIARDAQETLPASRAWRRLALTPVGAITSVAAVLADGTTVALPVGGYAIDIDAAGDGRVRVEDAGGAARVRVTYRAGLASDWNDVPEALRHGIARLAGHMFSERDGGGEPPAAVTALWRPYRRMRLQ